MLLYARGGLSGMEKFTIQDLLNDLEHFLESQIKSSQTHFVIDNHVDEIGLRGNQQMLLSALINLSMNAIQAMGRGGSLCVDVRYADATTLQLRIIDNGPGIDKDVQRKIFNPFYTTRQEGTGLGLAVVAAVVRAHEGEISLDSEVGEGSSFILRLPIIEQTGLADTSKDGVSNKLQSVTPKKLMSA